MRTYDPELNETFFKGWNRPDHTGRGQCNDRDVEMALEGCLVRYFLDGIPLRMDLASMTIDDYAFPSQVAAIEVYRRASELPLEFAGSDSRCGVVAIWTRRGNERQPGR